MTLKAIATQSYAAPDGQSGDTPPSKPHHAGTSIN
jgi:hypothetical protein